MTPIDLISYALEEAPMIPRRLARFALVATFLLLATAPALALESRYLAHSIDVADVTPGGEVVVFHASRQSEGLIPSVGIHRGVWVDEDGDGVITQELGQEAPRRAVVVAVDLSSGAVTLAAREASLVTETELPADALVTSPAGEASTLRHHRSRVEMVVVRPGVGAWKISAGDGAETDLDPTKPGAEPVSDGTVHFSLDRMEPVAGASVQAEPPAGVLPGDVLVMIDPGSFELYAVTYEG